MTGTDANGEESAERMSEWMKIMLDEMDRKRAEDEEGREELARRGGEGRAGEADRPGEKPAP